MPAGKNVIGYIRVSRVGGRSGDSFISPREQRRSIEQLARQKGLRIVDWLEELDESGANARRPLWNSAIEACECGEVDGIAVWNLKRFSRSLKDALLSLERIEATGASLYSASEDFDSNTTAGRTMRNMLFVMAEDELQRARDSFAVSTRSAIARGVWIAAKVPIGYLKDDLTKRLVPDPSTAPVVIELFERKASGESVTSLQRWLASVGYSMGRSSVGHVLANEAYLGVSRQGRVRNEAAHPPLVSRELFDRAAAARGVRPARSGALANVAMLKSLARCGTCGSTLLVGWTRGATDATGARAKIPAYSCVGQTKGGCAHRAYVRVDDLDAYVNSFVTSILNGDTPVAEAVASTERVREAAERLTQAEHSLAELRAFDYAANGLSLHSHVAMVAAAEARVEMSRGEFANAKNEATAVRFQGDLGAAWPTLTPMARRTILHGFISRVVVKPNESRRRVPIAERVQIVDNANTVLNLRTPDDVATFEIHAPDGTVSVVEAAEEREAAWKTYVGALADGRGRSFLPNVTKADPHRAWVAFLRSEHPDAVIRSI